MRPPRRDTGESSRLIGRRALILGGIQAGTMAALALRIHQLQVHEADQFRLLAEENRINIRLLPPVRGLIHDRTGLVVAANEQNYRISVVREDAGDIESVLARLALLIGLDDAAVERALREVRRHRPFVPVTVADRLSWEDLARVAANSPALPGVSPEVGLSRLYPLNGVFAHSVGYVGPVSERDLEARTTPEPLLQLPGFHIGKIGVEREFEETLRGRAGNRRIEVNAVGRIMRELERNEGTPGQSVQITLDHRLQAYVQARLDGQSGAAVVMDVRQGDLLACASYPVFDPNLFVRGISVPDFRGLLDDPYRPLADKSVQGVYPPGSTFKMVVALAALEAGIIVPEERVFCPGHVDVSGRRFHCWKRGGHGRVNLVSALSESCDVYFYDVAQRLGIERINDMAARLGLGLRHDLPLSAVAAGLNPTREWKQSRRGEPWLVGDTINASIGQGFVLSSPLQLAVMTARLATGTAVAPRLVRAVGGVETAVAEPAALGLDKRWLQVVQRGMSETCNHERGTAFSSRIVEASARMAGKTGTSQVWSITAAERAAGVRRQEDLPWNRRNHALFVGYAPEAEPRYAVAVIIEHGGGGSSAAAPVARDIMLQALHGRTPPLTAYPQPQRNRIETMQREIAVRMREMLGPAADQV